MQKKSQINIPYPKSYFRTGHAEESPKVLVLNLIAVWNGNWT